MCGAMTVCACMLIQSRELYHVDLANHDGSKPLLHPKHVPFHRRGGEKYALHLGHRPPKKQFRKGKHAGSSTTTTTTTATTLGQMNLKTLPPQETTRDVINNVLQDVHKQDEMPNNNIEIKNNNDNEVNSNEKPIIIAHSFHDSGNGPIAADNEKEESQHPQQAVAIENHDVIPENAQTAKATTEPVADEPAAMGLIAMIAGSDEEPLPRDPFSCESMMKRIQDENIVLVAFDFDKSILDIHTGGKWEGSASDLVPHVRPDMKCLIRNCLERDIHVAVATFSTQKDLIRQVLQEALGYPTLSRGNSGEAATENDGTTAESSKSAVPNIPVYGGDDSVEGHTRGKLSQLLLAIQGLNKEISDNHQTAVATAAAAGGTPSVEKETDGQASETPIVTQPPLITKATTLLVDDDAKNCEIAEENGYRTLLFRPDDKTESPRPSADKERFRFL